MTENNSKVLAEQTSNIYESASKAILATVINSIILVSVMWSVIPHKTLIIWLSLLLSVSLIRIITVYRYNKLPPVSAVDVQNFRQHFLFGSIISSVIWGAASIWLFPTDDLARQVFLAFVIGGMAAGAIISLSYIKLAVQLYLLFTLLPLLIRFFISGTELSVAMGSMISLILIIFFQLANQSHTKYMQNIQMHIDNLKQKKSLEDSEHRYETLIRTASDAFFLHDMNGRFVDVNNQACITLGYTRDELLSMSVSDVETNLTEDGIEGIWEKLNANPTETVQIEGSHLRKDGASIPVEVNIGCIYIDNEPLFSVLARDMTERKRIDKMKDEFISTVSHELRTPLTSIRGAIGLLNGGAVGELPVKAHEMLSIAQNNTDRLLFLINDILDMQKLESDELQMPFDYFDIYPLIQQSILDNEAYAEQYGVSYALKPFDKELIVYGNQNRLIQVMANLLSNATKFSYKGEVVEIEVSQDMDSTVKVSIIDHGEVIPEGFYSKIFKKFSQSDSSDTRQKGGTGLGLNISKAILEKHGGTIGFSSNVEKTIFYFELPLVNYKNY